MNLGARLRSRHGPSPWPGPEELGISLNEHSRGLEEGPQRAGGVLPGAACPFRGVTGSTRGQHTPASELGEQAQGRWGQEGVIPRQRAQRWGPAIRATLYFPLGSRTSTFLVATLPAAYSHPFHSAMEERLVFSCLTVCVRVCVRTHGSQVMFKKTSPASTGREWHSW